MRDLLMFVFVFVETHHVRARRAAAPATRFEAHRENASTRIDAVLADNVANSYGILFRPPTNTLC